MPGRTVPEAAAGPRRPGPGSVAPRGPEPTREERRFGLAAGTALILVGAGLLLSGSRAGAAPAAAGSLLVLLGAAAPRTLGPARRAFAEVSGLLARANTVVFLGLVFFLVLTPLGAALRLAGRDELARRRERARGWVPVPESDRDPRRFEKMF